jgi:gamma-carbonic anhydrase
MAASEKNESRGQVVVGTGVYIAPTSYVGGSVLLGDHCTVMHHVTIRGDIATIRLGKRTNVQDGAVLHTRYAVDLDIEEEVVIGHRAVVHCRRVGRRTLIGIGAVLLDNAEIGPNCVIAAGAVVTPGTIVPAGKLVGGVPGRILRDTSEADHKEIERIVHVYVEMGRRHAAGEFPNFVGRQAALSNQRTAGGL